VSFVKKVSKLSLARAGNLLSSFSFLLLFVNIILAQRGSDMEAGRDGVRALFLLLLRLHGADSARV
jgi:hypothetical protein